MKKDLNTAWAEEIGRGLFAFFLFSITKGVCRLRGSGVVSLLYIHQCPMAMALSGCMIANQIA